MFMTRIITFCCLLSSLTAETIGNIEYQLPSFISEWDLVTKETAKVTLQHETQEFTEHFFALYTQGTSDGINFLKVPENLMKKQIEQLFPNNKVILTTIDRQSSSIFYNFAVYEDNQELVLGWTREFITKQGYVSLRYAIALPSRKNHPAVRSLLKNIPTPEKPNIANLSNPWISILKAAKEI